MANLPWYGTAFNVSVSLYTATGLIANVGTLTCKISKDYGNWADCHGTGATDEDTTYGQVKVALDATDMTADHIDGYVIDDTSGCFAAKFAIDTIPVVRGLAGTALPNAVADAAGGLPISDAGALDLDTQLGKLVGTLDTGTHKPQTGDAYAVVAHADYGNAKLVRSTTPANALDVSATGEAGLDFANIKAASSPTTLTNITVPTVTTLTGHTAQTGDGYAILNNGTYGLSALKTITDNFATDQEVADTTKTTMEAAGSHLALIYAQTTAMELLLNAAFKGSFQAAADTPSAGYTTWTLYDLDDNLIATFVTTDATGSRAKAT